MSSSLHIDNKKRHISSRKWTNTRVRKYFNCRKNVFSQFYSNKFCLSLHYNRANSYLFVNDTEIYKVKAKDSEVFVGPICLGNISKDWPVDNMIKTGFTGYVYDVSVDYNAIEIDDIKNIHKYLMEKNNIV